MSGLTHYSVQLGGCDWGGYVNDAGQNNPTYEFYPSTGGPIGLNILTTTLPANLFPLTWLLPSGERRSIQRDTSSPS